MAHGHLVASRMKLADRIAQFRGSFVVRSGDILASSIEAYFDLDTPEGEEPEPPVGEPSSTHRVVDEAGGDILSRCFRFRYERSWARYYGEAALDPHESEALWRHALGTIAVDIPPALAFLLLLATRSGLPQQHQSFERLNRSRLKSGKAACGHGR
jgi:hypothetical protein